MLMDVPGFVLGKGGLGFIFRQSYSLWSAGATLFQFRSVSVLGESCVCCWVHLHDLVLESVTLDWRE